jgi:S1-C subfamily serine protease
VDASGLVVASNSILKPQLRMGRRRMPTGSSFNATPISLKIVREGDETEHDAFQVATDSELGLTFLQIAEKPANGLAVLDLATTGKPEIGERVLLVTRLGKPFDYAPYLQEAFIAGRIKKPRSAWILGGALNANNVLGLPVYNREGQLLGVFTTLTAETESGGERAGRFLLPPRPLKTAIGRAQKKAKELLAERTKESGEKKADGDEGF